MTRRLLVVCTANVCRSPIAERVAARRLEGLTDVDGDTWSVRSAGTSGGVVAACDRATHAAAATVDVDVDGHVPRRLDRELLAVDGADLVLAMARDHVRTIVSIDPGAWPRTFTLREVVRRAAERGPLRPGETFGSWLRDLGAGRRAADLMGASRDDDVTDPYGGPAAGYAAMAAEVDGLLAALVRVGPWRPAG